MGNASSATPPTESIDARLWLRLARRLEVHPRRALTGHMHCGAGRQPRGRAHLTLAGQTYEPSPTADLEQVIGCSDAPPRQIDIGGGGECRRKVTVTFGESC